MTEAATEYYLTGLRNQHAVEKQAISTIEGQLSRMEPYPELHARMQKDLERSRTQAERLDTLMAKQNTGVSAVKEAVTSAVGAVSSAVHVSASDEVVKNVLAAVGFKAYEIASYKALIATAEIAGRTEDTALLQQSMSEEQEMGDWLGENLPGIVQSYLRQARD